MNLTTLAQVVGMVLVRWMAPLADGEKRIALQDIKWRSVLKVTFIDMAANVLLQSALILVGGGVFVVFYSSCTLWTAVLSYCVSGKELSRTEWGGILMLTAGLMLSAISNHQTGGEEASNAAFGAAIMLVGTLCHSLAFVVDEAIIEEGMAAHTLCFATGSYSHVLTRTHAYSSPTSHIGLVEMVLLFVYNIVLAMCYDTPSLLLSSIHSKGATTVQVVVVYTMLTAVNALHSGSFFHCLGTFGAVGSAAMKGLQALSVFFLSSMFFCQYSQLQCATPAKTASMGIVFCGLFVYAHGASKRQASSHQVLRPEGTGTGAEEQAAARTDLLGAGVAVGM
jgi:hypothetical protein